MIIFQILLLIFCFYLLAHLTEQYFVPSLEILSQKLNLSSDVAGASLMAVGSSAPELFISLAALARGLEHADLGSGTIVGSALFNILVIVGLSAMVKSATLTWQPVIRDLLFYLCSIGLLLAAFNDGHITLIEAMLFVIFYLIYLSSLFWWRWLFPYKDGSAILSTTEAIKTLETKPAITRRLNNPFFFIDRGLSLVVPHVTRRPRLYWLTFILSIIIIAATSYVLIESAVFIAHYLGISEVIIGLTILAAGTSIADLFSSLAVAKKGKGDMAVANAVGSNVFDIQIGLGLPWLIAVVYTGRSIGVASENLISSALLLFATVISLLVILIARRWRLGRYAGAFLVVLYLAYILAVYSGWLA